MDSPSSQPALLFHAVQTILELGFSEVAPPHRFDIADEQVRLDVVACLTEGMRVGGWQLLASAAEPLGPASTPRVEIETVHPELDDGLRPGSVVVLRSRYSTRAALVLYSQPEEIGNYAALTRVVELTDLPPDLRVRP